MIQYLKARTGRIKCGLFDQQSSLPVDLDDNLIGGLDPCSVGHGDRLTVVTEREFVRQGVQNELGYRLT
jgi:hypothetical protein